MADLSLADRVSRLRPTAVNRVLQEVRQLQAEGRSLVSLMRGQPDTPTPPHIVEAARKVAARRPHRLCRQPGRARPAPGRRREAPARAGALVRSRPRDPHHRRRHAGRLCGPGRAGRAERRPSCCPTRSMMPMPRRSRSGAAGRRPSPRRSATAGSRSAADSFENAWVTGDRRHPAQHALEPGRHRPDARGARGHHGVRRRNTTAWSSATRSTSRWSTTAGGTSRRPRSPPTPASGRS